MSEDLTHTARPGTAAVAETNAPGTSPPGYELSDEIGRGGMGVVYRARDTALDRDVAVKLLAERFPPDSPAAQRFLGEARITGQLQHPGIPAVHQVGTLADGRPFLAMKLIKGSTLEAILKQRTDPAADRGWLLAIFEAVCQAVGYAHAHRVIHRDLKPSNVMVGAFGEVQVMDWGLAKILDEQRPATTEALAAEQTRAWTQLSPTPEIGSLTQAGSLVGTPAFIAPEQALGELERISERSDVFGLGALLAVILTGQPPYVGDTLESVRVQAVRGKLENCFDRLDGSGAEPELLALCKSCLAFEPADRPSDGGVVAAAVARFRAEADDRARRAELERVRVEGEQATALARSAERRKRRRLVIGAVAVLAVATVGGLGSVLAVQRQAAGRLAESNQHLLRAQGEREAALRHARQESARVALDRGLNLCEAGDVGLGLLYLTRALDSAVKAEDVDLESAIRLNLSAWETQLWALRNYREGPSGTWVSLASLSPRGSLLAAALSNDTVELWDLRDGHEDQTLHALPHGEVIKALSFSGDGSLLFTQTDRTVRIWDVATGRLAGPPLIHPNSLTAAALSRDGKWVLTGAGDPAILPDNAKEATARLWQTDTGKCIASLPHKHRVRAVAFAPGGEVALTGDALGIVQMWKVPSGEAAGPPLAHQRMIMAAMFSPDGARILTGTAGGTVHVWQVQTAKQIFPPLLVSPDDFVADVAFSPDGQRLVARTNAGRAYLWRADTGNPIASPLVYRGRVESAAFSPDGRTLLTGGAGGFAQGWDATRGQPTGPLLAHLDRVRECGFSHDGQSIVTVDGTVRRWQAPAGLRRGAPLEHQDLVRAVAFSPDGRLLLTGSLDAVARLWDTAPAAGPPRLLKPSVSNAGINAVAFSPDGRLALTGGLDKEPSLWDVAAGSRLARFKGHTSAVYAVAFSHDGKTALSGGADGTARLWDVVTAEPLAVLPHTDIVWAVAFSPDDRQALTGSTGGTAALWDLSTRPPVAKSLAHEGAVWTVAFSPDGHTAITADIKSGSIRLWETTTGTRLGTLQGHTLGIQAIAVSQDGQYLISGSIDRTARLWKLATGESVGSPLQHQAAVRDLAFSRDGRSVYTGSEDNTARRWHVPTGVPIGPAIAHGRKVQVVAVHPESTMFATGSWDHTAGLWEAPGPRNGSPAQLARWAERVTGIRLDDSSTPRVLTAAAWQETRCEAK
jgi:WD40 repeat protein